MTETDIKAIQEEAMAELYLKLLPYMLNDFIHKEDLRAVLGAFLDEENINSVFFATQKLSLYRSKVDNGTEANEIVKPLMEII